MDGSLVPTKLDDDDFSLLGKNVQQVFSLSHKYAMRVVMLLYAVR